MPGCESLYSHPFAKGWPSMPAVLVNLSIFRGRAAPARQPPWALAIWPHLRQPVPCFCLKKCKFQCLDAWKHGCWPDAWLSELKPRAHGRARSDTPPGTQARTRRRTHVCMAMLTRDRCTEGLAALACRLLTERFVPTCQQPACGTAEGHGVPPG